MEIELLEHIMTRFGFKLNEKKGMAIRKWKQPTTKKMYLVVFWIGKLLVL